MRRHKNILLHDLALDGRLDPRGFVGLHNVLNVLSLIPKTCGNADLIITSHIVLFDRGALITSACSSSVKFPNVNPGWQ